jgi:hypothetical protein
MFVMGGQVVATESPEGSVNDPLSLIEAEFHQGKLTLDEKVVLQATAIKKYQELPPRYQFHDPSTNRTDSRAATMVLLDIRKNWEQLSPTVQSLVSSLFSRPETEFSYVSPTGFFRLHYDTSGGDAVSPEDNDSNSIPDFVERCAAYCDSSLDKHWRLGYLFPPPDGGLGGDDLFDVYFEEMPYYGYALPEGAGPEEWNDWYSYLVLHRDFVGFSPNSDPEGNVAGAAKATCAHEFHHCVQFSYDLNEPSWLMELDATFMEDLVFDQTDDNYNYLTSYMSSPQTSLMQNGLHSYSSFIWELFVAQRFDTSLMVSMWEGARYDDALSALSDTLLQIHGWSLDSAFTEFAIWNYFTGSRADSLHHTEAADYPAVNIAATHDNYPLNLHSSPVDPAGYGACYIQFLSDGSDGNFRLSFDGDDSRQWAACIIKSFGDGQHEVEYISLSPGTFEGEVELFDFQNYQSVTLVGINLSEFMSSASFTYTARKFGNYRVSSAVLTTDTAVYSGASREFDYLVSNPSELNDIYDIIFWDDSGWVTLDTIDKFVPAGDSVVVQVPVYPPEGTPLGKSSTLHFMAVSKNDPEVHDEQQSRAVTILQHGDANFDGLIDLGDLTFVIAYLFISGPDPVPVMESGNFDCEGIVDLGDLTRLISYLFISFEPSPCNPF